MMLERETRAAGQTQSSPGTANVASRAHPGEFIHYYMNLLTLFRGQRTVTAIEDLARSAVRQRDGRIAEFSVYLQKLRARFQAESAVTEQRACLQAPPRLCGWNRLDLEQARAEHGGLLVALFHYGGHRQVLADLACMSVPFVAPVAKRAYFECSDLARVAPPAFEHAMRLIEVEDPRVGRTLLQSLRSGRIGVIYVDGNMGPDGHLVAEGAVEFEFLGCRIRVKAGIARLAQSLRLPIMPLLVQESSPGQSSVMCGPLLRPADKTRQIAPELRLADQQRVMQSLYSALASAVDTAPQHWEFAFCLHRWLAQAPDETALALRRASPLPTARDEGGVSGVVPLHVPGADVTLFERDKDQFWVHVGRQKAYRLPVWAHGLYALMKGQVVLPTVAVAWLREKGADEHDAVSLLQGLLARGLLRSASDAAPALQPARTSCGLPSADEHRNRN